MFEFLGRADVRRYIYAVIIAAVPTLTLLGLSVEQIQAITTLASAVLAVSGAGLAAANVQE